MANKKFWGIAALLLTAAIVLASRGAGTGAAGEGETAEPSMESAETAAEIVEALPVGEEEEAFLHALYSALGQKNLSEAAGMVHEAQDLLKNMLDNTLSGEKYLYYETDGGQSRHMEKLGTDTSGTGLVITRPNTVFFGDFAGGRPEGECLALQTVVLESLRYTFAEGHWENGKMNGNGRTGYRYCGAVPEGSFAMTEKEGAYVDNLIDGAFTYRAEAGDGTTLCWEMEAEMGVTVLTDAWAYDAFSGEYKLFSEEDQTRAYVLSEDRAGMAMWNNLIQWNE